MTPPRPTKAPQPDPADGPLPRRRAVPRRVARPFLGLAPLLFTFLLTLLATRSPAADIPPGPKDPMAPEVASARIPGEAEALAEMAAQGTNFARLFHVTDLCHDAGAEGDRKAVQRGEAYIRQALALAPTNAPARALLGSLFTMKARDTFWPLQQLRHVREGNALMDEAVSMAPEDVLTRMLRAFNNAHMPDFLGRTAIARADLAWLWEKAEKDPSRFSVGQRQEIALHWGRQLKRQDHPDEARSVWELGRSLAPDSPKARRLAEELDKLR